MKTKELKSLAKKIAEAEFCIQTETDEIKIQKAKENIMKYSSHVDWQDMDELDEMVQMFLQNLLT